MKSSIKKVSLITLGCPKNQVDSEVLAGLLDEKSLGLTADPIEADVVLINTCGFIQDAKQESIDVILKSLELKKKDPNKKIVVWGCLAERYRNEIQKAIPEVDAYFGVEPFESIGRFFFGRSYGWDRDRFHNRKFSTPPHTAYLKIAEGCDHTCSFCAIPQFKGSYRSRTLKSLVDEAEFLAERGVQELILVAQDTTAYGSDLKDKTNLADLLKRLVGIHPLRWIRILYAHPSHITEELIELISREQKICHYLDLPFQHISDPVLHAMKRGTPRKMIESLVKRLRSHIPGLTLRSSFIIGFPGETEKDFHELVCFIQETGFERLGLFKYSREERTAAVHLNKTIPQKTVDKRYHNLMKLQQRISTEHNRSQESKTIPVLVDAYDSKEKCYLGRTEGDAPEIDQTVWIRGKVPVGKIANIQIDGSSAYDLTGLPVLLNPKGEYK